MLKFLNISAKTRLCAKLYQTHNYLSCRSNLAVIFWFCIISQILSLEREAIRFQVGRTNLKTWKSLWIISREGLCERIRLNPAFVEERLNCWTYENSHARMRHRHKGREPCYIAYVDRSLVPTYKTRIVRLSFLTLWFRRRHCFRRSKEA